MKKFLLLLSVVALSFTGCYEDLGPETPSVNEIQLGSSFLYIDCCGVSGDISVNAPYAWTASTDASWIFLNVASGEAGESNLNLTIAFNGNDYDREGTITVFCDDYNLSATISVFQSARDMEALIKRVTNTLTTDIAINDHSDFGYPSLMCHYDHAIGEVFPSNAYSGGNQYYDRFQILQYHVALGPTNGWINQFWYEYYHYIKSANNLIAACSDEEHKHYRGIAKAFRAL